MPEIIGIDHIYVAVSDMAVSQGFYDRVFLRVLGFRSNAFSLGGEPHIQYYNRQMGYVLRPARRPGPTDPYAPGLHHLCLRVDGIDEVRAAARALAAQGLAATPARPYPDYAPDYWATFLDDPDGIRLEITNYRRERRERHDRWDDEAGPGRPHRAAR